MRVAGAANDVQDVGGSCGVKVAADKSKGEEKATVKMLLMVVTTSSGQVEVVMLGVVGGGFEECSRVSKVESVKPLFPCSNTSWVQHRNSLVSDWRWSKRRSR
jgi:hypothetical protein